MPDYDAQPGRERHQPPLSRAQLEADEVDMHAGLSGVAGIVADARQVSEILSDVAEFAASLNAVGHQLFTGALDPHRLSFPERVIVKGVKAPIGDFRDWDEIDVWAGTIAQQLKQAA